MKVSEIAKNILEEMGGDAEEICTGSCPDFAKALVSKCGGQIVSNLSDDMANELDGFEVIEPEVHTSKPSRENFWATSHCWAKIDGRYYDAFNTDGVEDESELEFIQNL